MVDVPGFAHVHPALRGAWHTLLLGAALLLATACSAPVGQRTPSRVPTVRPAPLADPRAAAAARAIAPAAHAYLDRALTLMQNHALNRDLVDWPTLRTAAFAVAGPAQTPAETYYAIRYALDNLYEGHSYFLTPDEATPFLTGDDRGYGFAAIDDQLILVWPDSPAAHAGLHVGDRVLTSTASTATADQPLTLTLTRDTRHPPFTVTLQLAHYGTNRLPTARALPAGVGYVDLPGFRGVDQAAVAYAAAAHQAIGRVARPELCGWIVDLRRNTGGNAFAMLAAVGPLLGEGDVGGVMVGSELLRWSYAAGQARAGANGVVTVLEPYPVMEPVPPVAVLSSRATTSAGEAVTVMFRGRAQARSFGEATNGVPSGIQGYHLDDGALLGLAVGRMVDRTGQAYEGRIAPDVEVAISWTELGTQHDEVLEAAVQWLHDQPACHR